MTKPVATVLMACLVLAGCGFGQSRLNPLNWFGSSQSVSTAATEQEANTLIPAVRTGIFRRPAAPYAGTPIDQVTALRVERVPGGAIIRATGLARTQGGYDVQLTPANDENLPINGVLTYSFDRILPSGRQPVGPAKTREITAAVRLTDQELAGVRTIRVQGARNAQVTRR